MSKDIEALLKLTIQAKVVEAFNDTPEMIDKLVQAAMSKEVNTHGNPPSRSGDTKMPYMEWLVGDEIRRAIMECVRDYVTEHKDEIQTRVKESIQGSDFAAPLSETLGKILSDEWRWNVNLSVSEDR